MEFIDLTEDHSEDKVVCLGITAKIESNDEGMSPDDEHNVMSQSMTESEDDHMIQSSILNRTTSQQNLKLIQTGKWLCLCYI